MEWEQRHSARFGIDPQQWANRVKNRSGHRTTGSSKTVVCAILSVDGAYEIVFAANRKNSPCNQSLSGFINPYLDGTLPYARLHIIVYKMR